MTNDSEMRALKAFDPDLFSDDPVVAHRAASPIMVAVARRRAVEKVRAIVQALQGASSGEDASAIFRRAVDAHDATMRNFNVTGGTLAERHFSEQERDETAKEAAFDVLHGLTIDQMRELASPTPAAATGGDVDGLLPCPFHDERGVLDVEHREDCWSRRFAFVSCSYCGASGPSFYDEAEAVKAWNTRATLSPSDRDMRDALHGADALALGPNGSGGMKVTINFADVQQAGRCHSALSDIFPSQTGKREG